MKENHSAHHTTHNFEEKAGGKSLMARATKAVLVLLLLSFVPAVQAELTDPHLLWWNKGNGPLSMWDSHYGQIQGAIPVSWQCGNGCSNVWKAVGTDTDRILWYNQTTGYLSFWNVDGQGYVQSNPVLSWTCGPSCAQSWNLVGFGGQKPGTGIPGSTFVLWHNPTTGQLSLWLVDASANVVGSSTLSWQCSSQSGCAKLWHVVGTGDFNSDGVPDILWHNPTTGELSVWLLSSLNTGQVIKSQSLSWKCDTQSGCANAWKVVGVSDMNSDGNADVVWFNSSSGVVSSWLTNPSGTVIGSQQMSWTCPSWNECSQTWTPVGIIPGNRILH
jgi:hypothetical protein